MAQDAEDEDDEEVLGAVNVRCWVELFSRPSNCWMPKGYLWGNWSPFEVQVWLQLKLDDNKDGERGEKDWWEWRNRNRLEVELMTILSELKSSGELQIVIRR